MNMLRQTDNTNSNKCNVYIRFLRPLFLSLNIEKGRQMEAEQKKITHKTKLLPAI